VFNSCHYQERIEERRREADWLHELSEYKAFPRERPVRAGRQWGARAISSLRLLFQGRIRIGRLEQDGLKQRIA
jgi:hypothetical protein